MEKRPMYKEDLVWMQIQLPSLHAFTETVSLTLVYVKEISLPPLITILQNKAAYFSSMM